MKILTIIAVFSLLIITITGGCKKENLTRNFIGTFAGIAVHSDPTTPTITTTYPGCKVVVTKTNNKTILLSFTLDPADPTKHLEYGVEVQPDQIHFYRGVSGPRGVPSPYQSGSVNGDSLVFKATGYFGDLLLDFKGERL
jgi:hypothetical protein